MRYFYLLLLLGISVCANAQTPVWSTDVAPIIYNHCATCHHSGGLAPFSLTSYTDAVAHASTIGTAVQNRIMPPWPPDPSYNRLAHERLLSAAERSKIVSWVNGGRPQGNPALEPPAPTFSNKGSLPGTPDLILKIPTYTSAASSGDVYRCFVLPTGLSTDKFITALEAIPGDPSIVHHVLIYADTTNVSTTRDAADPGPGYTSFGGIGTNKAILIGGWVPGNDPLQSPPGFGIMLPKNAKVVVQIHYPAGSAGMVDSTEVHLFFSPTNSLRNLMISPILNHDVNITTPLNIPANTVKSFVEQQAVPVDVTLFGVVPHMHLIGKKIQSFAVAPNGDTQRFISIPDWDFHWQGFYMLRKGMKIAAGSTAYALATYDNTTNNPNNPSNPPQNVQAGEATTDEMMVVYCLFSTYQPGDENIVIDSTPIVGVRPLQTYYSGVELLQPYPIPAKDELIVKYHLDKATNGSLELLDMSGKVVLSIYSDRRLEAGYNAVPVDVQKLPPGMYLLRLNTSGISRSRTISIQH